MVLEDAVSTLETFVWILNHVSRSLINLVSDYSQRNLLCGGVSSSILVAYSRLSVSGNDRKSS